MSNPKEAGCVLIEVLIVLGGIAIASFFLPAVQAEQHPNVQCEVPPNPLSCQMEVGPPGGRG